MMSAALVLYRTRYISSRRVWTYDVVLRSTEAVLSSGRGYATVKEAEDKGFKAAKRWNKHVASWRQNNGVAD
jgi:hypothetical protein